MKERKLRCVSSSAALGVVSSKVGRKVVLALRIIPREIDGDPFDH